MLATFFLIAGLYMVFKKEIRISSKRIIKGKLAQKIGIIFITPALLSYAIKLIPESPFSVILAYISLVSFALAFISIIYFIFFYKSHNDKNGSEIHQLKTESSEVIEKENNKNILNNFFRKDLGLEKKWWHRLFKIFFVVLSLIILIGSAFGFYFAEEYNAKQYNIVQNFSQFLQYEKEIVDRGCTGEKASAENGFNFMCFGGRILAPASFISQNTLKDYDLGCLQDNGKVEYLSEYSFKDDVMCDKETGVICTIPKNICGGNASNIVKYNFEIKYGFSNYVFIALKTLGVIIGWVLLAWIIYYKGLLYIIFGGKKHENN